MEGGQIFDYLLKLIVIGDTGVGKSCAVLQFVENRINYEHEATIGVEFATKTLDVQGKSIKMQIWDTAGQQNFRSITRSYYRSAIGALLIYDITRRDTFDHLKDWLEQVKQNGNSAMEIILVGNKNDLHSLREITYEQGKAYAAKEKLSFVEISAKDYKKVETAFSTLSANILSKIKKGIIDEQTPGVKIADQLKKIQSLRSSNNAQQKRICCL